MGDMDDGMEFDELEYRLATLMEINEDDATQKDLIGCCIVEMRGPKQQGFGDYDDEDDYDDDDDEDYDDDE